MLKRIFDLWLCFLLGLVFSIPLVVIFFAVRFTSSGSVIYWSDRVGRFNKIFRMPKFRTMLVDTPAVPSHLLKNPSQFLTPIGDFLRKSSLDELPQLWCVLVGDMSFIGPRPALFNQDDLIQLRSIKGIHTLVPGLTGWAQVNGRDNLSIAKKVNFDEEYLKKKSFIFDLKILYLTFIKIIQREDIKH